MTNKQNAIKAIEAWISDMLPKLPAGQEGQVKAIMSKAETLSDKWYDENLTSVQRATLHDYSKGEKPISIVVMGQDVAKAVMQA